MPARTQTVVIFLCDIRSCIPTRVEWDELSIKYKRQLDLTLNKSTNGNGDGNGDCTRRTRNESADNNSAINTLSSVDVKSEIDSVVAKTDLGNEVDAAAADAPVDSTDDTIDKIESDKTDGDDDKQPKADDSAMVATTPTTNIEKALLNHY